MTNEEAKKMLKAKLDCLKNETSGVNYGCNMRLCDGCSLNYEQGNIGEQKEALDMAIKALEEVEKYKFEIAECKAILDNPTPDVTENDRKRAMYVIQTFPDIKESKENG